MTLRQRFIIGAAGIALALAGSMAQAGPYSAMYVFGDSLSDVGNDALISGGAVPRTSIFTDGTTSGRFTNGYNYIDYMASFMGLSVTPSVAGGTNYAYGGARVDGITPALVPLGGMSFNQQVASYVGSHAGAADPNALYVLWAGANNVSDGITTVAMGGSPSAIGTQIGNSIAAIGSAIGALGLNGAQHFLVLNLPDLSQTPVIRYAGSPLLAGIAQSASVGFNSALAGLVGSAAFSALDITLFDVFTEQTKVTNDPAAYGFTDTTHACYTGDPDGAPRPGWGAPTTCADASGYMYFDYMHPSEALHNRLALLAYDALAVPEPTTLSLLFAGLGMMGFLRRRQMRG